MDRRPGESVAGICIVGGGWINCTLFRRQLTRFDLLGKVAPFGTETANYPTLLLTGE